MTTSPYAVVVLDGLTDREFGFVASLVRPSGVTREQYREQLTSGQFDAEVFVANVSAMRAVAPDAWSLRVRPLVPSSLARRRRPWC